MQLFSNLFKTRFVIHTFTCVCTQSCRPRSRAVRHIAALCWATYSYIVSHLRYSASSLLSKNFFPDEWHQSVIGTACVFVFLHLGSWHGWLSLELHDASKEVLATCFQPSLFRDLAMNELSPLDLSLESKTILSNVYPVHCRMLSIRVVFGLFFCTSFWCCSLRYLVRSTTEIISKGLLGDFLWTTQLSQEYVH